MEVSRAIDLIDDKMCWGRGTFSAHHMPERDEYWQAGEMAIDALKKQEEDRWHPVAKEGEPKESGSYLLTLKNGWVTEDFYHIDYGEWGKAHQRTIYEVVAWREKPEPYTEEEL